MGNYTKKRKNQLFSTLIYFEAIGYSANETQNKLATLLGNNKKFSLPLQPASTGSAQPAKAGKAKKTFFLFNLESPKVCLPLHSQSPTGRFGKIKTE